jgi:hypothetical protein
MRAHGHHKPRRPCPEALGRNARLSGNPRFKGRCRAPRP